MKKLFIWLFGIVIFAVVILVAAAFIIPYVVDPNEYKGEIIAQAKPHMMGRDLKIPGNIKISILPWLGFELGEVIIGNADGFVIKPFATIKQSKAHINIPSLLTGKIEIGSLEINGVVINLQKDAEGRDNWSDLSSPKAKSKTRTTQTPKNTQTKETAASTMAIPPLKVQGIHFGDMRINYLDKQNKTDITVSKINIEAGPIDELNPVPISTKFNYHSKSQGIAAAAAMATTLIISPDFKDIQFDKLTINTNVSGKAVSNKTISTSFKVPALKIDLAAEQIEARPFYLSIDKYKSEGRFKLRRFTRPQIRLGLEMQELNIDEILPPTKSAAANKTGDKGIDAKPIFSPLLALKDADLQGTISIKKLHVRNLDIQDLKVNLLARGGLISALPEAKLYGGTYSGDVQIQVRTMPASLRTRHKLQDVQIGPIVEALTGKPTLTGKAKMQGQFFTEGNTVDDLTRNLSGDLQFNFRNAELKLVDAEKMVLGNMFKRLKLDKKQDSKKTVTAFDSIRGTVRVKSGVAYNKDLRAVSKRIHFTGKGHAILFKQEIKYTLYTIFKKSLILSIGSYSYDLKNKKIPTHIRGNWSAPEIDNDIEEILKRDFAGSKLDKKKTKLENKVKSKLDAETKKLKDKLKNLLKR